MEVWVLSRRSVSLGVGNARVAGLGRKAVLKGAVSLLLLACSSSLSKPLISHPPAQNGFEKLGKTPPRRQAQGEGVVSPILTFPRRGGRCG